MLTAADGRFHDFSGRQRQDILSTLGHLATIAPQIILTRSTSPLQVTSRTFGQHLRMSWAAAGRAAVWMDGKEHPLKAFLMAVVMFG